MEYCVQHIGNGGHQKLPLEMPSLQEVSMDLAMGPFVNVATTSSPSTLHPSSMAATAVYLIAPLNESIRELQ